MDDSAYWARVNRLCELIEAKNEGIIEGRKMAYEENYRIGYEIGFEEGRNEARAEFLSNAIHVLKEDNISDADIIKVLELSDEEVREYSLIPNK